ncbi:MAG TPA: NAD(P)-binding domain-containing protein, partial [Chryseolinea sp.]|nr:NAD(P)-binding domain-containing protein [Chryseolinea sp.]
MKDPKIAILGGGNLGASIAEGLIKSKFITPQQLTVTRRNVEVLYPLKSLGVHTTSDNHDAVKRSDVIIVALKPYNVKEVMEGLQPHLDPSRHIIISVAT